MAILKSGYRKGSLELLVFTGKVVHGNKVWLCKCDCGEYIELQARTILYTKRQDCGCTHLNRIVSDIATLTPLMRDHLYNVWHSMVQSCDDPQHPSYPNIGARDIHYSRNFSTFPLFVKHMPKGARLNSVLVRKNEARGYTLNNVKWIAHRCQSSISLTCPLDGTELSVHEFAKKHNVHLATLRRRIQQGCTGSQLVNGKTPRR